jgi:glutaredoxin-related protein
MLLDFEWNTRDTITVCDYFVKEWFPLIIYKLSDGQFVDEEEWEEIDKNNKERLRIAEDSEVAEIIKREIPHIVAERQTEDYRIMHYRMLRNQILDFSEWPSKQLPIIFVDGDSYYIDGRQYTKSFIHEARDAQKFINYVGSEIAAEIKNRRREQWLGTPDNIIGYEQEWRNPELQMGILRAKPDPKTGQMPQKMPAWDLSPALLQNFQRGTQDIQEILGFSESEALQGRDISGKARRERRTEGSMSAYVFLDNLNQSVAQGGRVTNDLLPHIAGDDERHMVISKKDGKTRSIILNQKVDGQVKNQIEKGDFDVELDAGPSFSVQKDVALEFFQQTLANNPQVFNLIADLWASNLDIEQMDTVKDRLKTLVPPEILAKEEGKPPPPPKPNPQEMMMKMEMEAKQSEMQERQAKIQLEAKKIEQAEQKLELDKAKLMVEARKTDMDAQLDVYDHKMNVIKTKFAHESDKHKTETNFSSQIAKILADIHKHETQHEHEKHMGKNKAE